MLDHSATIRWGNGRDVELIRMVKSGYLGTKGEGGGYDVSLRNVHSSSNPRLSGKKCATKRKWMTYKSGGSFARGLKLACASARKHVRSKRGVVDWLPIAF